MIINVDNVVPYLLDKRLIDIQSIIDGNLRLTDVSRKNRNVRITRRNGTGYLLKQPDAMDPLGEQTIKREANLYMLAHNDSDFSLLKGIMPAFITFDDETCILILEYMNLSQSLKQYIIGNQENAKLQSYAATVGRLLASFHHAFNGYSCYQKISFLPKKYPITLFMARPGPDIFSTISKANLQLIKMIQQDYDFWQSLGNLPLEWKAHTVIHGDMRLDNVILSSESGNTESSEIRIADWEFSDIGDPAWDVGGVIQDFISFWIFSMSITGMETAEEIIASNHDLLLKVQAAIGALWCAYASFSQMDNNECNRFLTRSLKYCAARLVQTAFESLIYTDEITNNAVYLLQLSLNILREPSYARVHLLGVAFNDNYK